MNKILIDTCVWLDLAKDPLQEPILEALEHLISSKQVLLILPETVVDEFYRNKSRIEKESKQSLSTVFKRVKDAVNKFGDLQKKELILAELSDIDHKIPIVGESTANLILRIEQLFKKSLVTPTSDQVKLRAAQRAIDKVAPFHLHKNSINDAILIEVYGALLARNKNHNMYFITHNTKDYSAQNNSDKKPHPDLSKYFDKPNSIFSIKLAEVLHDIQPDLISDIMMNYEPIEEPRAYSEILQAENELFEKVWYNRHQNWLYRIQTGKDKIVNKLPKGNYIAGVTTVETFKKARKAAKRVEKKYGLNNLGPWDDFEWGMMNGKLSAIRWVIGSEWDFLDT